MLLSLTKISAVRLLWVSSKAILTWQIIPLILGRALHWFLLKKNGSTIQLSVANFCISVHLSNVRNGLLFLPFHWVLRTWKFNKTCMLLSGYQRLKWDLLFFGGFRSKEILHPRRTIFPVPSRPAVSFFLPPPQRARRRTEPRFGAANPLVLIYVLNVVPERPKQRQSSPLLLCIPEDWW